MSFLLEGIPFAHALRSTRGAAGRLDLHPLRFITQTSNPTLRAVFFEDAAALAGIAIAAIGVGADRGRTREIARLRYCGSSRRNQVLGSARAIDSAISRLTSGLCRIALTPAACASAFSCDPL